MHDWETPVSRHMGKQDKFAMTFHIIFSRVKRAGKGNVVNSNVSEVSMVGRDLDYDKRS